MRRTIRYKVRYPVIKVTRSGLADLVGVTLDDALADEDGAGA